MRFVIIIVLAFVMLIPIPIFAESYPSLAVKVEIISENLSIPWSIDFASDDRIFFSERIGTLHVIDDGVQNKS